MNKILDKIRFFLIAIFTLSLPLSIAVNNISLVLIVLYWLFFANKKETLYYIKNNPIVAGVLFLYISLAISLLWSDSYSWGFDMLLKEKNLLFLPILITLIKEEEREILIKLFILSMSISELISYAIKFGIIAPFLRATVDDPTPFMSHIFYNPFLTFTIYLLLFYLFNSKENLFIKLISIFFIITMSINQFITGGRAGQVAFFALVVLAIFQFLKVNLKSILIVFIGIPLIFTLFYNSSTIFKQRVDLAISNIKTYKKNPNTSVGKRLVYSKNTLCVIKKYPIFGAGIGDFPNEYEKCSQKNNTTNIQIINHNPHNMYLFTLATGGVLSFIALLFTLFAQIKIGVSTKDKLAYPMVALAVLYLIIMFSETYLLQHNSTAMFVLFSAILFKNATWRDLFKGKRVEVNN